MARASGSSRSRAWTSCSLPSETWMKLGMLPRKSSSVCILTAALVVRKCAHGKDGQTKIDGRRVERIDCIGEIETQILVGVQPSRLDDQSLSQFRVDAPVACLIGIGQGRASHRVAEP